jgi:uncharacterized protein YndB with AHSA1/START domain
MPKKIRPPLGKRLKQTVLFQAPPRAVYDLLMVSKLHAAFTGEGAKVSPKVDGPVRAYGGYIEARNVLLLPGKRIVQAWRAEDWVEGWYSTATWEFDAVAGGTRMTFIQDNIPADALKDMQDGWVEFYWEKMKDYLKKKAK